MIFDGIDERYRKIGNMPLAGITDEWFVLGADQ
jgi:hypothetical protein